MNIEQQHRQADAAYHLALAALASARQNYLDGSGKTYAGLLDRQTALRDKIAEHTATADQAEATFKHLFAQANYTRTKEVKAALFEKNDALSMADELRTALRQVEAESIEPKHTASRDAQGFLRAYGTAYVAYARREAWRALQEHGPAIAEAMALLSHAPTGDGVDAIAADPSERRMGFVWDALKRAAEQSDAWEVRPQVDALGPLELGPFAGGNFVTPAEAQLARKMAGIGQEAQPQQADALPA